MLIPTSANIRAINVLIMQYVWTQKELISVHAKKAIRAGPMINPQAWDLRTARTSTSAASGPLIPDKTADVKRINVQLFNMEMELTAF